MKSSDVFRKRNLTKVNFEYENLIGKDLSDSNLSGVNLVEKDIHNADMSCCDLSSANLSGTILFSVKFRFPDIQFQRAITLTFLLLVLISTN